MTQSVFTNSLEKGGFNFFDGEVTTHSDAETRSLGEQFSPFLTKGDVVALNGDLGAGKTCLVKGICSALGVEDTVNSPTFILVNHYSGHRNGINFPIYHLDFYRLAGAEDLDTFGADEFFEGNGICLIEWAVRAADRLPDRCWMISIEYTGHNSRTLRFRLQE